MSLFYPISQSKIAKEVTFEKKSVFDSVFAILVFLGTAMRKWFDEDNFNNNNICSLLLTSLLNYYKYWNRLNTS